ncbi:MAG: hypothetical protein QXR50_05295 [Archaeoglobaceae archaeon]
MDGKDDIKFLLGELSGKTDRILCELQKINEILNKHESQIEEHDRVLERHKSYFKIIGGVLAALVTIFTALLSR